MGKRKTYHAWLLVTILVAVIGGGVLFMLGVGGWFNRKTVTLDAEYRATDTTLTNEDGEFLELLSAERYEELAGAGKSFVVFIDQIDCVNANRMREYITQYAREAGIKIYRMMFSEMKESSLHEQVKYYPSTVVISKGKVVAFLDASAEEDAEEFNDYAAFKGWMDERVE